ncbi:MAG: phospholipid/cholesterol/gamma-HCH transport system permease protein [Myxococcota bacterium]|jgi:phospholipid/cholesterol/gamma-HCH transport system permease protein
MREPERVQGRVEGLLAAMGGPLVGVARNAALIGSVARQTLGAIVRGKIRRREVVRQCYLIGNQSVLFITVTLGFLGLISVFQVATQMKNIIPDYTLLGAAFIRTMTNEFAPTICGLMIATRVGSGIAAEIGSMVVTDQVDALRMCNADPVRFLVVPRTVASAIMLVMLTIYAVLVATAAGMFIANTSFDVPTSTFLNLSLVRYSDVVIGLIKAVSYGVAIPIVAGQAGLSASGGSAGVGWATTRAVVNTSFTVVILDFIITGVSFFVVGR